METAVEVKFLTTPIPAPGGSQTRYTGGRLTYYGAAEIEPAAAAVPNVSVRQNDVVQVAPAAGAANNGDEPFLAQVRREDLARVFSSSVSLAPRCCGTGVVVHFFVGQPFPHRRCHRRSERAGGSQKPVEFTRIHLEQ